TIEVLNILAKYPEWDRSPHRLKLPPLTRDSRELPDMTDHIKPASWRGDTSVKKVSLQTSWKRGRCMIEAKFPQIASILRKIDNCPGADILAPLGKLLVNAPLDDDDIDESLDPGEVLAPIDDNLHQEVRVEIENILADEEDRISGAHSQLDTKFASVVTID
ncbi:hypothetical protein H0H92_000372, partial [Tricholoma furcatifolium]